MAANAAVVIPVYKENLNELEKISLMQVKKVLGGKYPIIFVAPEGKNFSYFSKGNAVVHFPQQFFQSVQTYNLLMMTAGFYKAFLRYEYILLYQLDAFVFSDKLEYFCSLGYDNIGAPWPWIWHTRIKLDGKSCIPRVGNGGFCLRNVRAAYNLLINRQDWLKKFHQLPEDIFFSCCGMQENSGFRTAPINIAYQFSVEYLPERTQRKNGGDLPFGCHAFNKFSADFYTKTFLSYGYDLSPFKNMLNSYDSFEHPLSALGSLAHKRLQRRVIKGQPIFRYLSQKNFASVRVIRNSYTILIVTRLLLENNSFSDKIFFYDETEQDILISDLQPEKLPHLIITNERSGGTRTPFIDALQRKGLTYGTRFITFNREYLAYCERLFHNLGKG